ncbi:hypothetical protein AAG570_005662 [Ranatra chinensis]|uniref:Peptidase S1 domain-containing protein n=1 Tax=Ranatra chinensis TaxID=642074 RepID=A0ABD0XY40_9HEMI
MVSKSRNMFYKNKKQRRRKYSFESRVKGPVRLCLINLQRTGDNFKSFLAEDPLEEKPERSDCWPVSIHTKGKFACSGVIVDWQHVVTLASCVQGFDSEDIKVRTGSSMIYSGGHVHSVKSIETTGLYSPVTLSYDMSHLTLDKPITLGPTVLMARVAERGDEQPLTVKFVGWTVKKANGKSQMKEAVLNLMVQNDCCALTKDFESSSMLCAKAVIPNQTPCWGDFGGAIVNKWHALMGLHSWSVPDCSVAVFSNLPRLHG